MDFNYSTDAKRGSTINPADLHSGLFSSSFLDGFCGPADTAQLPDLSTVDSAVDLTSLQQEWSPPVKLEAFDPPLDQFFDIGDTSAISSTPSPAQDMIFSTANSPGDFIRDQSHSQTGSPETTNDFLAHSVKQQPMDDDKWKLFATPEAIHIPQTLEKSHVYLIPDKTKTRAETQIKVQLILDPVDDRFEYIRFPRKTLAKPKLLASADEQKDIESRGEAISMELFLVCATAIEKPERHQQALRRARGEEKIPRRQAGLAISEIDKEDPSHPQNGGEVLICEGCKERERKRYDRKKKRAEDEAEWWDYEDDRIIMINEKEYKKWKDVDSGDQMYSSRAKQVEFAMRIACYCRHQEEKSPVGYRVIFTFKDCAGNLVAQQTSEIFQITDDHKNKEVAPEALPRPLTIPQPYVQTQYAPHPNVVPIFTGYSMDGQYAQSSMPTYSQPQTPVMSNFQSPMSPIESQFPQTTPNGLPIRQQHPNYSAPSHPQPPPFNRTNTQPHYDAPMLSPASQVTPDNTYLPRPVSMDNFNFSSNIQYPSHNGFQSAPPSAVSTPINLSRPASPSWDQGPRNKKMMCVYFYVDDE